MMLMASVVAWLVDWILRRLEKRTTSRRWVTTASALRSEHDVHEGMAPDDPISDDWRRMWEQVFDAVEDPER
jgi:hypothetical protein